MQTQRDADMEVESGVDRNVTKQQHDADLPERLHSEQLPVTTNQQSRCFTEDQTSVAHNEYNIQPHLQSSTDALEKSNCCKFLL